MRILFLTPNLSEYSAAFYQWDFFERLKEAHTVTTYGPGFDGYDPTDSISAVLEKLNTNPDLICLGHGWLSDEPGAAVAPNKDIQLDEESIPTVLILNKVYRNLEQKIQYAIDNEVDLVFSHHHKASEWSKEYDLDIEFWPFAVNRDRFRDYGEPKEYDFTFSGILRNSDPSVPQTDVRIRVQDHLFYTLGRFWLYPKPEYQDYNIFWNIRPQSTPATVIYRLLHGRGHLPADDYKKLLNRSKVVLNTHSPMQLMGTRYFETMASKSLALCQESPLYEQCDLFEPGTHCVTFSEDLSDFDETLSYYLEADDERRRIAQNAHDHVMENHTWTKRVEFFTSTVRDRLL